jgi:hypothetical protein
MKILGKTQAEVDADKLAQKTEQMRQERNRLLSASDWTQVPDAPTDKAAWAAYRQALRDITELPLWPEVEWPVAPTK